MDEKLLAFGPDTDVLEDQYASEPTVPAFLELGRLIKALRDRVLTFHATVNSPSHYLYDPSKASYFTPSQKKPLHENLLEILRGYCLLSRVNPYEIMDLNFLDSQHPRINNSKITSWDGLDLSSSEITDLLDFSEAHRNQYRQLIISNFDHLLNDDSLTTLLQYSKSQLRILIIRHAKITDKSIRMLAKEFKQLEVLILNDVPIVNITEDGLDFRYFFNGTKNRLHFGHLRILMIHGCNTLDNIRITANHLHYISVCNNTKLSSLSFNSNVLCGGVVQNNAALKYFRIKTDISDSLRIRSNSEQLEHLEFVHHWDDERPSGTSFSEYHQSRLNVVERTESFDRNYVAQRVNTSFLLDPLSFGENNTGLHCRILMNHRHYDRHVSQFFLYWFQANCIEPAQHRPLLARITAYAEHEKLPPHNRLVIAISKKMLSGSPCNETFKFLTLMSNFGVISQDVVDHLIRFITRQNPNKPGWIVEALKVLYQQIRHNQSDLSELTPHLVKFIRGRAFKLAFLSFRMLADMVENPNCASHRPHALVGMIQLIEDHFQIEHSQAQAYTHQILNSQLCDNSIAVLARHSHDEILYEISFVARLLLAHHDSKKPKPSQAAGLNRDLFSRHQECDNALKNIREFTHQRLIKLSDDLISEFSIIKNSRNTQELAHCFDQYIQKINMPEVYPPDHGVKDALRVITAGICRYMESVRELSEAQEKILVAMMGHRDWMIRFFAVMGLSYFVQRGCGLRLYQALQKCQKEDNDLVVRITARHTIARYRYANYYALFALKQVNHQLQGQIGYATLVPQLRMKILEDSGRLAKPKSP